LATELTEAQALTGINYLSFCLLSQAIALLICYGAIAFFKGAIILSFAESAISFHL
jgi:hypothetical protein